MLPYIEICLGFSPAVARVTGIGLRNDPFWHDAHYCLDAPMISPAGSTQRKETAPDSGYACTTWTEDRA